MSPDPSIVRRHFKYLFLGYNGSFGMVHLLVIVLLPLAPIWYYADDGPDDRRVRNEGRVGDARIVAAENETVLLLRKRVRLTLEVTHEGRTLTGSAAVLRGQKGIAPGRTIRVHYFPEDPGRMAVQNARSVLSDAAVLPLLGLIAEGITQLSLLGLAWSGASILRHGRTTVGEVTKGTSYKGLPLRSVTIEIEGKKVTQMLAMPWWAREPGRYVIAYLPGKPKKMVPVAPFEEEDTEGRP